MAPFFMVLEELFPINLARSPKLKDFKFKMVMKRTDWATCLEKLKKTQEHEDIWLSGNDLNTVEKLYNEWQTRPDFYEKIIWQTTATTVCLLSRIIQIGVDWSVGADDADTIQNLEIRLHSNKCDQSVVEQAEKWLEVGSRISILRFVRDWYRTKGDNKKSLVYGIRCMVESAPNWKDAYCVGSSLRGLLAVDKSVEYLELSIQLNQYQLASYVELADLYEKANQLNKAHEVLSNASNIFSNHSHLRFLKAKLLYREKKFSKCKEELLAVDMEKLEGAGPRQFLELCGKCCDRLGHIEEAFRYFCSMNDLSLQLNPGVGVKAELFNQLLGRDLKAKLSLPPIKDKTPSKVKDKEPIFILGFPRSGTTLVQNILDVHSRVVSIEEGAMIPRLRAKYLGTENVFTAEDLSNSTSSAAKADYFDDCRRRVKLPDDKIFVDKLPLNVLHLPLIHRLFPNAKYLMVVRHPLDSILSCFMQNFELNPQMANFTNLHSSATFYNKVFEIYASCVKRYQLRMEVIRYENIVDNFDKEVQKMVSFLDLDWDPRMLDFNVNAKSKKLINTPSYEQVVEPVYSHALGRWQKYSRYTQQIRPLVEKWIKELEYE